MWERPLRASDLEALGDAAPDGAILGARVEHSGPRRRWSPTRPASTSRRRTSTATRRSWSQLDRITLADLEEVTVEAWLARAPAKVARTYLDDR